MMYGADADELLRLAAEFNRTADELDREGGTLTRYLNQISWVGDVATNYVGQWTGVHIPRIGLSTQFLRDAAAQLARHAAEQREASASDGSRVRAVPASYGIGGLEWLPDWAKAFVDDAEEAIERISLVLLLAPFVGARHLPRWIVDKDDWRALRMVGTKYGLNRLRDPNWYRSLGGLTTQLRRTTKLNGFVRDLTSAATWGGAGLDALLGGLSVYRAQREFGWGAAETIEAELEAGFGTAFSFVPGGSIAFSAGQLIGDGINSVIDRFDLRPDGYTDYIERTYGTRDPMQLTDAQRKAVDERYSGWSGLFNANVDTAIAAGRGVTGAISRNARSLVRLVNPFD
jgi:hypothetical protein